VDITRDPVENGQVVLHVSGDMDADSAYRVPEEVAALFEQERPPEIVVDLSGVSFLDSVGLGMLVRAQEEALANDAAFRLRAPSEPVSRVLSITAMDTHFAVLPG
jgi:anti-sigma B factor antagonist